MICEIKHYQQLTVDELYRVIQLRIQGFIVENKVCYQDLEDKYDKHQYYMMWYENGEMIGVNALCYKKKFKGYALVLGYSQMFASDGMYELKGITEAAAAGSQNWAWAMLVIKPKFLGGK